MQITVMTNADIDFGITMTENENWGYLREDFERLLLLSPAGCFVARVGDVPVGLITSMQYGNYGYLGTLIVAPSHRGGKVGEALMLHAIAYLKSAGAETIELDGVFMAVPLYRRLGFFDCHLSLRMIRPGSAHELDFSDPEPINFRFSIESLLAFDYKLTGIDRSELLLEYSEDFKDRIVAVGHDDIEGYAFVRPRSERSYFIGPAVAVSYEKARDLYSKIITSFDSAALFIGIPDLNPLMIAFLQKKGFVYKMPSLRMRLGPAQGSATHVYGIISPEKG